MNMLRLPAFYLATVILSSGLGGCVSPAGIQHDQALREPSALGAKAAFAAWPEEDWWKKLGDPQLDQLIAKALRENPGITQAAKRLEKAYAYAEAAGAALKPQLDASLDISRQRLSENAFYPPPFAGSWQSIANGSLNASWDVDFWGRNRSALQAALSQSEAAKAEQAAARLLVSTTVARAYNQLARQVLQEDLAKQALQQREKELRLVRQRLETGLDTKLEERQGESQVAAARVDLQVATEAAELTRNLLAALTVQDAQALKGLRPALNTLDIQAVPEAVPADLIGRRPDLAAARARVDAATADIASAKAEFYPNVSLSAFVGLSSFGLSKFLELGSTVAGVGPAVHLPIFDAGRLRANLKAKNDDLDIAIASYNQVLLDAVHDVADQMTSLQSAHQQVYEQQAALDAAERAYQLASQRYEAGIANYLSVLAAADVLLRERMRSVDLRVRVADLNIALVKSLGGGYDMNSGTKSTTANAGENDERH